MRLGGKGKGKKNGVLMILVSKLHVTEKGRIDWKSTQLCKTMNRKKYIFPNQRMSRENILFT